MGKSKIKLFSIVAVIIALIATLSFAGCKTAATETTAAETTAAAKATTAAETTAAFDASQYPLGLVLWLKNHPVVQIMETGFLNRAKELGYPATLYVPDEADVVKAISLGEAAIAAGVKGLNIYLLDPSVIPLIKKANDAGIPVVSTHTKVNNKEDWPGLTAWASCDSAAYGVSSAEAIGAKINGKGTVALSSGSFQPVEMAAFDAFKATMKDKYPDVKIIEPIEEGYDQAVGISRATALIQSNKDIVAIFSTTGGGPTVWATAKDNTKRDDIVVISMDYSRENLDLLKAGKIYALVAQPLYEEFAFSVDLLDKILRGKTVEYANELPAPLIFPQDIPKYEEVLLKVEEAFKTK